MSERQYPIKFSGGIWGLTGWLPAGLVLWIAWPLADVHASQRWLALGAALGLWVLALAKPGYIVVDKDSVSFRDHWPWSRATSYRYADIRCFEYERLTPRRNNNIWTVVAITSCDGDERRIHLPAFGRRPFAVLKTSLNDWQVAYGRVEPLRFADFSENVRL